MAAKPWIHGRSQVVQVARLQASMGPWPQSHGYRSVGREKPGAGLASMGPWPQSHGYVPVHRPGHPLYRASMGPWPQSHGYSPFSGKSALMMPPVSELIGAPARPALLLSAQTHCPPSHNRFLCEGFLLKESTAAPLAPLTACTHLNAPASSYPTTLRKPKAFANWASPGGPMSAPRPNRGHRRDPCQ